MRLVSFDGGFGRVDGSDVVPMGADLVSWLAGAPAVESSAVPLASLRLRAPVPRPGKIFGVGLNYRDHAEESGQPVPEVPILFAKFAQLRDRARRADRGAARDRAAGLRGRARRRDRPHGVRGAGGAALDHVAGYLCCNDVSARDLQLSVPQWTRGKAIDTFLPCGPELVTADEVADPQALGIWCVLNGTTMQDSTTAQMVFGVAELVSFISQACTLEPAT